MYEVLKFHEFKKSLSRAILATAVWLGIAFLVLAVCENCLAFQQNDVPQKAAQQQGEAEQENSNAPASLDGESLKLAQGYVRKLSDPDYAIRQRATRALWEIGEPAIPLLENVLEIGRGESKVRASDLLILIRIGLRPDVDAQVASIVSGFLEREQSVQIRVVQKLCSLNQRKVAMKLIQLVESKSERDTLFDSCFRTVVDAEEALRLGDFDKFERWISDSAANQHNQLFYFYYLWTEGTLDQEIERLKPLAAKEIEAARLYAEKLEQKSSDSKQAKPKQSGGGKAAQKNAKPEPPPRQRELRKLIGLLRFLERSDEAIAFADKLFDKDDRRKLTHTILMENGRWKDLADLIVDATLPKAANPKAANPKGAGGKDAKKVGRPEDLKNGLGFIAEGYRRAVIQFYAGADEDLEKTIAAIEKKISEGARKKKGKLDPHPVNSTHATLLQYLLQFDRSLKYQTLKRDSSTFDLLVANNRYEKLFEVFKLKSFEDRELYFNRRLLNIQSLCQMTNRMRVESVNRSNELAQQRDDAINMYMKVVSLLASLGLDEEAEYYYRRLYFEFSDDAAYVIRPTIVALRNIGAYESMWEIAKLEAERSPQISLLNQLLGELGYDPMLLEFLDSQLQSRYKNPIERYRRVAKLIKSPTVSHDETEQLWELLEGIDAGKNPEAMNLLFLIWDVDKNMFFQPKAREEDWLVAKQLLAQGDFLLAAQKFEAIALIEGDAVGYAKAWYAYDRAGESQKAKTMRLLFALKFDPDEAYDYPDEFNGMHWQALPFDAYRLHDCLVEDTIEENCYYIWRMTQDDKKKVIPPKQAMVRCQLLRFNYIESPYMEGSESDHPNFIGGCLATDDTRQAVDWFRKLADYRPADSGLVENVFPALNKNGGREIVDEMFEKVSNDFFDILKRFPDSSLFLNNYAWACACSERNVQNAIAISKRAVAARPGRAGYWDTLAELYFVDKQYDLAIETIRKAIVLNPMREYYQEQLAKFEKAKASAMSEPDTGVQQ